mgnify:CR=1 FL=1
MLEKGIFMSNILKLGCRLPSSSITVSSSAYRRSYLGRIKSVVDQIFSFIKSLFHRIWGSSLETGSSGRSVHRIRETWSNEPLPEKSIPL